MSDINNMPTLKEYIDTVLRVASQQTFTTAVQFDIGIIPVNGSLRVYDESKSRIKFTVNIDEEVQ